MTLTLQHQVELLIRRRAPSISHEFSTFLRRTGTCKALLRRSSICTNWHYYANEDRRGWLRNMYYSLMQQLVRTDPMYYALTVAARPDKNWRLISVPYYCKDAREGESTGFRHLVMNANRCLKDGSGSNAVQGSVSLDTEDEDGCTVVVKSFHRVFPEWWAEVSGRMGGKRLPEGENTNLAKIYTREDIRKYGGFEPVPCTRGGIRLSRPDLPHGPTVLGSSRL